MIYLFPNLNKTYFTIEGLNMVSRLLLRQRNAWARACRVRCGQFAVAEFQHCWIVRRSNRLVDRPWCPTVTGLTARDRNWNVSVIFTSVEICRVFRAMQELTMNVNTDVTLSNFKRLGHFLSNELTIQSTFLYILHKMVKIYLINITSATELNWTKQWT